jgi:hypothetical protein
MKIDFSPKQIEAIEAIESGKYNFILFGGAIRGGKSWWGLGSLIILCEIFPGSRWCVIRENTDRLRTTTIPSFLKLSPWGKLRQNPYEYHHHNGSTILFKGENIQKDPDLDSFKGLEVNGFLLEEINECQQQTLYKCFERAGSWIIPNSKESPKPIIIATCNPTNGWVKELIYLPWRKNSLPEKWVYIPAKITDNPYLSDDYKESLKNLPRYEYEVFVEGNWDIQLKTGGEFLKGFELVKHVKPVKYNQDSIIHISIDSNVDPYIAITCWQLIKINEKWQIRQINELPAIDPNNTARKAGEQVAKWLQSIGYNQRIFMYGDRSTKNRNNIDDNKRSFYQIFVDSLKKQGFKIEDKFLSHTPSVSLIGDFVNAIFDGTLIFAEIIIGEHCKKSINDYIETKQDKDGSILKKREVNPKTKVSYEPNGHLCFIGETMILTHEGQKRIDEIQIGDYVLTRFGYKKVINTFKNGIQQVKTYKIDNKLITCTPSHKFWTKEHGFYPICLLIQSKTFCIFDELKNKICKKKLFVTEVGTSIDIQNLKNGQKRYIIPEGLILMELIQKLDFMFTNICVKLVKLLKDFVYIIKIIIHSIMILTILSVKKKESTCQITYQQKNEEYQVGKVYLQKPSQPLSNGINLRLDLSGIKSMLKILFLEKNKKRFVLNVIRNSQQRLKIFLNFVAKNINGNIRQESQGLKDRQKEFVRLAEKKSMVKSTVISNVIQAEVFNIEVEEIHEYFANGILVKNCDTLKDFIVQAFNKEFNQFVSRFKQLSPGGVKTVNQRPKITF